HSSGLLSRITLQDRSSGLLFRIALQDRSLRWLCYERAVRSCCAILRPALLCAPAAGAAGGFDCETLLSDPTSQRHQRVLLRVCAAWLSSGVGASATRCHSQPAACSVVSGGVFWIARRRLLRCRQAAQRVFLATRFPLACSHELTLPQST